MKLDKHDPLAIFGLIVFFVALVFWAYYKFIHSFFVLVGFAFGLAFTMFTVWVIFYVQERKISKELKKK